MNIIDHKQKTIKGSAKPASNADVRRKSVIRYKIAGGIIHIAVGRQAQTLAALVKAGEAGITALEAFRGGWAVRLAAYIHALKAVGVPITATRELHDGGFHARYVLGGDVEVLENAGAIVGPASATVSQTAKITITVVNADQRSAATAPPPKI